LPGLLHLTANGLDALDEQLDTPTTLMANNYCATRKMDGVIVLWASSVSIGDSGSLSIGGLLSKQEDLLEYEFLRSHSTNLELGMWRERAHFWREVRLPSNSTWQ